MWKKTCITLIILIGTFITMQAYFNPKLKGNSGVYQAGGEVNGRLGSSFIKGDRIVTGIKNPQTGSSIIWQLLLKESYTDYGCTTATACSNPVTTGYIGLASESIGRSDYGLTKENFLPTVWSEYTESKVYKNYMIPFNNSIDERNRRIINYRNLTNFRNCHWYYSYAYSLNDIMFQNNAYMIHSGTVEGIVDGKSSISSRDLMFNDGYWSTQVAHDGGWSQYDAGFITENGTMGNQVSYGGPKNTGIDPDFILEIRPAITFKLSNVVFAVSSGNTNGMAKVTERALNDSYSDIRNLDGKAMKLRILNENIQATLHGIKGKSGTYTNQVGENQKIKLSVTANAGSDEKGNPYTLSAILLKDDGKFFGYLPLSTTVNGENEYELDLSGIDLGKYKIAVVNEAYNESDNNPADCSALSDQISLEILPAPQINYHPIYSGTPSVTDTYEYHVNVNAGDIVGKFTVNNGVRPIQLSIISDDEANEIHRNDYQAFGLSQNELTNNNEVSVSVINDLNQGEYYFKLKAEDDCGTSAYYRVHLLVNKITPKVAFEHPDQTKKTVEEAGNAWSETATAIPSDGTTITYTLTGGDIGIIDIDENTGEITYKGNGVYGKVTIRATADDDPATGNDNYNSAFTEKEIIIIREVDGVVTPDQASSDIHVPTFAMDQANVKVNGIIGTVKGMQGTPDTIDGSTTTYSYVLKSGGNAGFFKVNASSGVISSNANLAVGTYSFIITVSDKWSSKDISVTVNVGMAAAENLKFYENSTSNTAITTKNVKATDKNISVYATVKGSSNTNPVKYKIKDGSTNVIEVNETSGAITIHGVGTVTIVAEKQGASGQASAQAELTFTVTAGSQNFIYTDNAGNELAKSGNIYNAKVEVYAPNKTFQLYTAGNPAGSAVTFKLKSGSPTDVISVDSNGLVTILNASLNNQMGKVIVQATSHDPSGNFEDKTIELPINIDKGTRVISFAENPIYVTSGKGKVTPVTEVDGVMDTDGDVLVEVDSNEDHTIAWTNDNKTIEYNYTGDTGKDIKVHATKPMDRNYKAAEADGILHIMGPDENILAITSPGQIYYGDKFTIRSSQYDADSTNVKYTFELDKTTYISSPTISGNSAQFDALKYSGTNKTTITVTRTADGETPLSKKVQVTVLPKPIEITIDDKERYKGEQNPTLTYQDFQSELVSWNGVQDKIQENDIKLNTTAKTDSSAGSYPIKGDANSLNKIYSNYSFTFKEGTLTINEENIEDEWYHLEVDDGNNTEYTGSWTNKDVNIISDHNEYINMSLDQSTWKQNQVTVSKEGETNQSFWMKKDSGAITKEKQGIIRIDKTAPKVKGIKAKDTNNTLQDIINKVTGGVFFKPGTAFEITTSDEKDDLKVSGTKGIAYKVYKIETKTRDGDELVKEGTLTVTNEKASITISETSGAYKVCVAPTDNAGNTNAESCHALELKKIDVDVDDDDKPDFNDPDGDGCPDLNIKWKDSNDPSKWIVINGDRDYDGIPDLNIDSDGDGKPDLNIDTDHDGKPDLNLVILKKSDWKPTKCVKQDTDNGILEEYCTGTTVKAVINVDTDEDGIPNINIDNKGDFKPHLNIAKDGKTPTINLIEIHEWKPKKDYKSNKFTYDSIGKDDFKPELNIDSDGDDRPDLNIDLDGDGEADINIDMDGDDIPDIDIDSTGDGIPDVNVDTDGDGKPDENIIEIKEWKPSKNVDGELPYDTMDFGEADEPEKSDDSNSSDNTDEPNGNDHDTSVKGMYNPVTSMGGANTGDSTNLLAYMGISLLSISLIFFVLYKRKSE